MVDEFCDKLGIEFEHYGDESDLGVYVRLCDSYKGPTKEFLKQAVNILGVDGVLSGERSVAVAFSPNQIKNADNKTPTADPDIRYSSQETDLDNFDVAGYPKIKLSATDRQRLEREAMTWNADKVGKVVHQTLSNQYTYVYYFDEGYNITVLNKYKAINIHERQGAIDDKRNRTRAGRNNGRSWSNGRTDTSDLFGSDRGTASRSNRHSGKSQPETRSSERRGYAEGAFDADKNGVKEQLSSQETDLDTEGMSDEAKAIIKNLEIRAMGSRYLKGEYASYSSERIERELAQSSATKLDYAKSYIAWVNPDEFLYATTTSYEGRGQIEKEAGALDLERLRKQTQPIHLTVDFETGKIVGHEGRHRMTALRNAGVNKVAVIFDAWNDDRYNTKPVGMMRIGGQEFDRYHSGLDFYVHDMLPLSRRYADATRKLFSEVDGSLRFSTQETDNISNRDMLANAFETLSQNSKEYKMIQEYKGRIRLLNEQEEKLSKLNAEILKIRFGKGKYDAERLAQLEAKAKEMAKLISKNDKKLLSLEASEPFCFLRR